MKVGQTSLPIAVGLLLMMYPVLAKVRYSEIGALTADRRMMAAALVLNWVIGPLVMFALAWLFLAEYPQYRTGVILVGLARCIAMVLLWNDLACGDREMAAVLVALNALFQVLTYAALGVFYLNVLPGWLGLTGAALDVSPWTIATTVLIFLGIPLLAGYLTRTLGERRRGRDWYEQTLLPRLGPIALYGLLFTVVILFALQGDTITSHPVTVALIAVPLLGYFAIMWTLGFLVGRWLKLTYPRTTTMAFTASGNDFELAIAVAIGVFGVTSGEALAGVVGPLIEVPVLLALVYVALWLRTRMTWPASPLTPPASRPAPVLELEPTVTQPNTGAADPYADLKRDLAYSYDGVFSAESIARAVEDARTLLEPVSRISRFLPILVAKQAKEALLSAAQAEGRIVKPVPELLFVCVHNAGRSQMAAALAEYLSARRVHVRSAGSAPVERLRPDRHAGSGRAGHLPNRGLPQTPD